MKHLPSRWPIAGASLAAILLLLAAYSNSFRNSFHFDDSHVIVDNLFIRDLTNVPRFFTDALTFSALPANATYRPVVSITLAVDYWLAGGLNPAWFHLTQIALLIATGGMLFFLYLKLFASAGAERRHYWAALFAATLFCIHTGNTQTANYISARSELLSGLGVLGAFLVYLYVPHWRRYYLYLLPLAAGALAKAPAAMFAPLLLAWMLLIEEQLSLREIFSARAWPRVRRCLLASAPAFVASIGLLFFLNVMNPPTLVYGGVGRSQYLLTQMWVWVRYAWMFFLPTGLSADTDLQPFDGAADFRVLAGLVLVAGSLVLAWRASSNHMLRPVAFGIAWFWLALIPSSIFPLAEVTNDHRVFFPFMGLTAAVVWWVAARMGAVADSTTPRRRIATVTTAAGILILGAHAVATHARNRVWLNEETLWADVVKKSPKNGRGLMNYGLTQMARGRYPIAKDYFTRAYALLPKYPVLHVNLGIITNAMGDSLDSERWFRRALDLDSNYVGGRAFYSRWLVEHGRAPEAIPLLERALAISPADLMVRHSLLNLYAGQGASDKLEALAQQTLALAADDSVARGYSSDPGSVTPRGATFWYERGLARTHAKRHAAAAHAYRMALAVDSTNADVWNNLGWSLGKLGFFPQAVAALERAIQLRPNYQLARNNLAWARSGSPAANFTRAFGLQTSGRLAEAIPIYRQLLAESPAWVNARYNLAHALMTSGQCAAAVTEFERTLQIQPRYPLANLHLSTCLTQLGRPVDAARQMAIYDSTNVAARPVAK